MKIAVIGSRNLTNIDLCKYIDADTDEIVSGGAIGIDSLAAEYARSKGIKLTEFLPQYELYGRGAPIVRNKQIVDYADKVIAFWDGSSGRHIVCYRIRQKDVKALRNYTLRVRRVNFCAMLYA